MADKELANVCLQEIRSLFAAPEDTEELHAVVGDIIPLKREDYTVVNMKGRPSRLKAQV